MTTSLSKALSYDELSAYAPTLLEYTVETYDQDGFLVAVGVEPGTGRKVRVYQGSNGAIVTPNGDPDLDQITDLLGGALHDAVRVYHDGDGQTRTQIKTKLNTIVAEIKAIKVALSAFDLSANISQRMRI